MRSSIGSIRRATASSSIAHSSAYMPGASLGARIHDGNGTSSGARRCVVAMFGAAYIMRVAAAISSTYSLVRCVCAHTSWVIASRLPLASAPRRTRWIVGVRWLPSVNTWRRVSASFTGRPGTARAAMAASTVFACTVPLEPKPPPTNGALTSTCSGRRPNSSLIVLRTPCTLCVESYRRSVPSLHSATVVCGSIAPWCWCGVVYVASIVVAAARRPASASPCCASVSSDGEYSSGWSARSRTSCSDARSSICTRLAACTAISRLSATTAPTIWPRKCTSGDCRIDSSGSSVSASFGGGS